MRREARGASISVKVFLGVLLSFLAEAPRLQARPKSPHNSPRAQWLRLHHPRRSCCIARRVLPTARSDAETVLLIWRCSNSSLSEFIVTASLWTLAHLPSATASARFRKSVEAVRPPAVDFSKRLEAVEPPANHSTARTDGWSNRPAEISKVASTRSDRPETTSEIVLRRLHRPTRPNDEDPMRAHRPRGALLQRCRGPGVKILRVRALLVTS